MQEKFRQFHKALTTHRSIMLVIKGSPDPDAIASAYAIQLYAEQFGVKVHLVAPERLSLPQNKAFVRLLGIPLHCHADPALWLGKVDAYGIVDHQNIEVRGLHGLPCAFHIDHHQALRDQPKAVFRLIEPEAGATATILTRLFLHLDPPFDNARMRRVATALVYGILTDTDNFALARPPDNEAIRRLTPHSDRSLISRLIGSAISERTLALFRLAQDQGERYKDWLFAGIGTIGADERDTLALVADMLLKREKPELVAVYALVRSEDGKKLTLDASLRCSDAKLDLDRMIKKITHNGGARHHKGAFQVPLDFFTAAPDGAALWRLAAATTVAALKKQRDNLPSLRLRALFDRVWEGVRGVFGNHPD